MPPIMTEFKNHLRVRIEDDSFNLATPTGEDEVSG
jgi:hypothetical protein